ncbi:hypothetical protein WL94_24285 [Burkholderia cepacia]|nr:hypothetical protein WL94_24285 [Burkholderia cepacia]
MVRHQQIYDLRRLSTNESRNYTIVPLFVFDDDRCSLLQRQRIFGAVKRFKTTSPQAWVVDITKTGLVIDIEYPWSILSPINVNLDNFVRLFIKPQFSEQFNRAI